MMPAPHRANWLPLAVALAVLPFTSTSAASGENPSPRHYEVTREWASGGHKVRYKAISGDTFLVDDRGEPNATIFSFAYLKDLPLHEQAARPVTFVFNGGPGSSSVWLHLGTFGPRRVRLPDPVHPPTTPPFELEDNPYWLLDATDIVMIDPVGTGFSRPIGNGKLEQFTGKVRDAVAVTQFIETWTRENRRWNSPKFVVGESYGTTRAVLVANMLFGGAVGPTNRLSAVTLNGVMLLGQAVAFGQDPDLNCVTSLPSLAAAAWYHNKVERGGHSLEEFVALAKSFADGEYRDALFAGDRLSAADRNKVAQTLSRFVGIPSADVLAHDLRFDTNDFRTLLLKPEGQEIGLYDSRYTYPRRPARAKAPDVVADDPAMGQYTPSFVAAFSEYVRTDLGVPLQDRYEMISFDVFQKFEQTRDPEIGTAPQTLATIMRRNPRLHLLVGSGDYDLATTAGNVDYQFTHMDLPRERVTLVNYPAGHMLYLGDESSAQLAKDLRAFIAGAVN
jgi:carboxypeptidase C (cathepsin A)